MTPGFGANTRRTSGDSCVTWPATRPDEASTTELLGRYANEPEAGRDRSEQVRAAVELRDRLQALDRREDHLELASPLAIERVAGPHPDARDRLAVVVQRHLLGR